MFQSSPGSTGSKMICEMCGGGDGKYCCPACERRTCSLKCVKDHKLKFECSGLRHRPVAPEYESVKYNEDMFLKDYKFLEGVNEYTGQLEACKDSGAPSESEDRKMRGLEFKRIQKVAKLAELRMLPEAFSRCKRNQTHFVKSVDEGKDSGDLDGKPEKRSTRLGRIAWTIDFVEYDTCKLHETRHEISDETEFGCLIPGSVKRVFLRNETRLRGIEKWREVGREMWGKTLGQVLVGGRFFEYPQIGLEEVEMKAELEDGNK